MDSQLHAQALTLVRDFLRAERLKLRRYLVDRLCCELDLDAQEAEDLVSRFERDGQLRTVEISHYDPAAQDVSSEPAIVAHDDFLTGRLPIAG